MRLLGRIWGIVRVLGQALSKMRARLHLPRVGSSRIGLIVGGIMVCGALVLLAVGIFALLKAQSGSDDSLPTGDLSAIITPAGHDGAIPGATATPAGRDGTAPAGQDGAASAGQNGAASTGQGGTTPAGQGGTTPAGQGGTIPAVPTTPLPDVAAPVRMIIEKIGMDAPIITMGLDANRWPEVPYDPYVVTWYDFSAKPGQGSNAVFAGHVDWTVNGQPVTGVFWGLRQLVEGDVVKILREDGSELQYRVTHSLAVDYNDPDGVKVMYGTPNDVITLISCGGTWVPDSSDPLGGNYTHRVVIRAELVA